jgi:hypothetical protein
VKTYPERLQEAFYTTSAIPLNSVTTLYGGNLDPRKYYYQYDQSFIIHEGVQAHRDTDIEIMLVPFGKFWQHIEEEDWCQHVNPETHTAAWDTLRKEMEKNSYLSFADMLVYVLENYPLPLSITFLHTMGLGHIPKKDFYTRYPLIMNELRCNSDKLAEQLATDISLGLVKSKDWTLRKLSNLSEEIAFSFLEKGKKSLNINEELSEEEASEIIGLYMKSNGDKLFIRRGSHLGRIYDRFNESKREEIRQVGLSELEIDFVLAFLNKEEDEAEVDDSGETEDKLRLFSGPEQIAEKLGMTYIQYKYYVNLISDKIKFEGNFYYDINGRKIPVGSPRLRLLEIEGDTEFLSTLIEPYQNVVELSNEREGYRFCRNSEDLGIDAGYKAKSSAINAMVKTVEAWDTVKGQRENSSIVPLI